MALKIEHDAAAVREAFAASNLEVEDDAIHTCVAICADFALTADELAARYDAYSMNHQVSGAVDVDKLSVFRSKLAQDKAKTKESGASATASAGASQKRKLGKISGTPVIKREIKTESQDTLNALYNMKSPDGKHPSRSFASPPANHNKVPRMSSSMFSPTSMQSPPGSSYENRADAGKIVTEFNAHLKKDLIKIEEATSATNESSKASVSIRVPFTDRNMQPNAEFMYTPLFERALALDEQLVEYENLVKTHYKIEELGQIADPSPSVVTVVGRIVCEAAEGKLNPSVVQLEGSRKSCGGQRVLLDLSGVPSLQLFPGKIVALEGVFEDGRNPMVVKRFLEPVPAPMPTTKKSRLEALQMEDGQGRPIRVITACGPFTTTGNISYAPLADLLTVVKEQKPDVLVVVGPFIDSTHASFQDGLVEYDNMMLGFEDIFLFKVMATLDSVLGEHPALHIVMVPSLRDAHHQYVYPQPPFNKRKACEALAPEHTKRVHMMPNPCTFSVNDAVFGVSALDIVMHLSSNELHRAQGAAQNRLLRLSQQVVEQQSFYPLFPPPSNSEAPIDLRYMQQFQFEKTPDVLILPSMLNRFCGRVQDSICINPGQLCKGESGGTFAFLAIMPLGREKIEAVRGDEAPHYVPDRTVVDIKRI